MPTYATPGVFYERVDAGQPVISSVRTDVAGFVGIATKGLVDTPVPVESWRQFQAHFGDFTGAAFLAYAVRGYFENGGKRCWIVRVASSDPAGGAQSAFLDVSDAQPVPNRVWRIAASSPGSWGNALNVSFRETNSAQTSGEIDARRIDRLRVASTAGFERGTLVRISQGSLPSVLRVVADIDTTSGFLDPSSVKLQNQSRALNNAGKYLVWEPLETSLRLNYTTTALAFDPDRPVLVESIEYTLIVEQQGIPLALYLGLSLIPEHRRYGPIVLGGIRIPTDVEAQKLLPPLPEPVVILEQRPDYLPQNQASARSLVLPAFLDDHTILQGGSDGLRLLQAYDFVGEPWSPLDSDEVRKSKNRGLRTLEAIDEVAILAVPDIHIQPVQLPPSAVPPACEVDPCLPHDILPAPPPPQQMQELPPTFSDGDMFRVEAEMILQCEAKRDRFALLDPPRNASRNDELGISAIQAWRHQFDTKYAALYYPWLRVVDPLRPANQITRDIPPSGHVAGQFARTDLEEGVHKAPANAPLQWTQDVTVTVNDAQHGGLNPEGIDVVRPISGRGIRIFGARTVSSDPDWRYVNVRRLMMMIEKAIDLSTQWATFEPNDHVTRAKIRLALTSFLLSIWQRGALVGETAREAFFVECDETNNPTEERANGRLLAIVGVAPTVPCEFVVLRVGRTQNEFEIAEQGIARGVR